MGTVTRIVDHVFTQYFGTPPPDARSKDLFMMDNAGAVIVICFSYLGVCLVGPVIMHFVKPFDLKRIILFYNAAMVAVNAYIVQQIITGGWLTNYKFFCQLAGSPDDPASYQIVYAVYIYLLTKFAELLDTVFFILRKKERQISFLHVYHHYSMVGMTWAMTRYLPDGHGSLGVAINAFIHVVMYSYYLLAAFGPSVQKYLWWKKYLTRLQLVQFVAVFAFNMAVFEPSCKYPKAMVIYMGAHMALFFVLFANFYIKNYTAERMEKSKRDLANMCIPAEQLAKED